MIGNPNETAIFRDIAKRHIQWFDEAVGRADPLILTDVEVEVLIVTAMQIGRHLGRFKIHEDDYIKTYMELKDNWRQKTKGLT
jgi:predicted AlkP superfamily phosphohydrolase/phosphomutase